MSNRKRQMAETRKQQQKIRMTPLHDMQRIKRDYDRIRNAAMYQFRTSKKVKDSAP